MGKYFDLVGERFGRLRVSSLAYTKERGRRVWSCLCDCGESTLATTDTLRAGTKKSCGCMHRERAATINKSHGMSGTRTYRIWSGIVARCCIPSATGFAKYGGRGIKLCARWYIFENFLDDMGECPTGLSIDRMDVDGDYEPSNCRWVTTTEQSRNTSRTRYVIVGDAKRVARDVAKENGISEAAFKRRLYMYRWTIEESCGLAARKSSAK
mgnify:CR=1 FL=1